MNQMTAYTGLLVLGSWLIVPIALLVLAVFSAWTDNPLKRNHCWRFARLLMAGSMATTLAIGLLLILDFGRGGEDLRLLAGRLGLYPDGIAVWMALMVGFIGWVILRFAENYLRGDPGRDRFLPWFLTTIASVLILVFTNNLLVLAGAWVAVSLSLHHLLTLYPDRPQARLAAIQKFMVSRAGDVLVIGGVWMLYLHYGSFYLADMVSGPVVEGGASGWLNAASVLLALAAILKCAQVPFHGWLLRVMEAPTPVSALLHAGVINLGGFLWLRLFPVFDGYTTGHLLLVIVGGATAVVAVLTMMAQYSVKHGLAWSTCAQMGFMLFEIGLGAYTLALLHLLAHSLYKAHSFLASGRTVKVSGAVPFADMPLLSRLGWGLASGGIALLVLLQAPGLVEGNPLLGALLVLAVANVSMGIPAGASLLVKSRIAVLAVLLVPIYSLLHGLVGAAVVAQPEFSVPASAYLVGTVMAGLLVLLSLMILTGWPAPLVKRLRWQFSQGLNLDLPLDMLTRRLSAETLKVPDAIKNLPHHPFAREKRS